MEYYYTAKYDSTHGWRGEVYHYENANSDRQIVDYVSPADSDIINEAAALDDAAEWAEDHGIEAEMD